MKKENLMIVGIILICMTFAGFTVDVYSQEKSDVQEGPVVQKPATTQKQYTNSRMKRSGLVVIADLNVTPLMYTGQCPATFTLKGQIYANSPMTVLYKIVRSDNLPMEPRALTFEKEDRKEITYTWQLGDPAKSATLNEWAVIEVVYPLNAKIRSNVAFLKGSCGDQTDSKKQDVLSQQEGQKIQSAPLKGFPGPQPQDKGSVPAGFPMAQPDQQKLPAAGGVPMMPPGQGGQAPPGILPIPQPGQAVPMPKDMGMPQSPLNGLPEAAQERCVSFDPTKATIQQVQSAWSVVDGPNRLFSFGIDKIEAENSLAIIKYYQLNKSCFVGGPRPSFHYMLAGNTAPSGPFKGEDCLSFNPVTTNVQQIKGNWKVGDGDRALFDFGTNKTAADNALAIIKKYGFTYSCMMARGKVDFVYLRK